MPIYFATNRDVVREGTSNAEFGERLNADGPQFFRVGLCEVALQPGRKPTDDDAFEVTATNLYREQPTARSEPRPLDGVGPEQVKGREPIIPGRSWRIRRK